ncbi:MoaD/ThiS family protein [Natronococcus sp. JC468]|uniref:ubiquitin-like small modifier protein SAMP2 n=1 Tax=Natronococcus sp. JC468 TaxID=1961921 RepID=UPI00143C797D|nr:ubiquitin-like small modifier protein 2 [Natronococcus sp. JC468]NKE34702.1 MoaD/ThiS family protein [Natronococcus sp. JC468]
MRVTVDVKGEDSRELELADVATEAPEPTYADLLREVGLSLHEVSVLVDGRPVPEDQPVESERVTVLRLIKGG